MPVPTIHGFHSPSPDDYAYMEYLDDLADDLPGGESYGLLLLKGDPTAFFLGRDEWLAEQNASVPSKPD